MNDKKAIYILQVIIIIFSLSIKNNSFSQIDDLNINSDLFGYADYPEPPTWVKSHTNWITKFGQKNEIYGYGVSSSGGEAITRKEAFSQALKQIAHQVKIIFSSKIISEYFSHYDNGEIIENEFYKDITTANSDICLNNVKEVDFYYDKFNKAAKGVKGNKRQKSFITCKAI